jgi:putative DNA methylase
VQPIPTPVTLLEGSFPFREVSRLVEADRRSPDPAYQAHRWWARRPPALVRAVLLAACAPADLSEKEFWKRYASPDHHLRGRTVRDPFLGGGTTLVEAARLGATSVGADVDPLAGLIADHQLSPAEASDLLNAGEDLLRHLRSRIGALWPASVDADGLKWQPVHYFTLASVTCPGCRCVGPLYRSLVLARSVGKAGSVRRMTAVDAFCPSCLKLHDLPADAERLRCCDQEFPLDSATFVRSRYECPTCGLRSSHESLSTGTAHRTLVAVEETPPSRAAGTRRIRAPRPADKAAITKALRWSPPDGFVTPTQMGLVPGDRDQRPVSYGVDTVGKLHTPRQIAYLAEAFAWIDASELPVDLGRALRLAVSTTITSNNRLCGYATDYGRLAPLFSVRAFALPWLTVELNPLNPTGGRGTLAAALRRVAASCDDSVRRHVVDGRRRIVDVTMNLARVRDGHRVTVQDSTATPVDDGHLADVCVTDPPYFDFIPYDVLSQVFRSWLTTAGLSGNPLHPSGPDPVKTFGSMLGSALASAMAGCKDDALLAFTYKGDGEAWQAVGVALDEADMIVTALWPVLADPHMGHHSHEGNCEYDILVVARRAATSEAATALGQDLNGMLRSLRKDRKVSAADVANLRSAFAMATDRRGAILRTSAD